MTLNENLARAAQEVLGYLNFSSGASDPKVLRNVNLLYAASAAEGQSSDPACQRLARRLLECLDRLEGSAPGFDNVEQARAVLHLTFERGLPAYRQFHRDLLFHQSDEYLFQPFFIGRFFEAVLSQGAPWGEHERVVQGAISRLNDYVGHRPVAMLRTASRREPYAHEWVRPIPLYVAGAGVAVGRYQDVLEQALTILRATDDDILRAAQLDPDLIEEIAVDPRAYDFDHPANKRPNYHFGQWDPHVVDNQGRYRRFVLRQIALDVLVSRVEEAHQRRREVAFEAAAVLAGVLLMASGVSGRGPDAHDSSVTLATLLPRIAAYRDQFYRQLLAKVGGEHGDRLREEATRLRQPFGGARQHLNYQLARFRADQLQQVHLALIYARMGYPDAARAEAAKMPVVSARMRCEISIRLTLARRALDQGELEAAARQRAEIEGLLHRAIECGALVDPWNILGFQANFSLFPALENTVHDHRVDELIELMRQIFSLDGRLQCQAAVLGRASLRDEIARGHKTLADWWDQFATTTVSGVEHVSGGDSWQSASKVAGALAAVQLAGPASASLAFWRRQVNDFRSPKAYALVIEALIDREDLSAAMALLMHWLGEHERMSLEQGEYSFHELAVRWMNKVLTLSGAEGDDKEADRRWQFIQRFFDFAEANAENYWHAPRLRSRASAASHAIEPAEQDDLFRAAYEGVSYRDSTADGFDGSLLESGPEAADIEREDEARRITQHLGFLFTMARLWKALALAPDVLRAGGPPWREVLAGWLRQARVNEQDLQQLLVALHDRPLAPAGASRDSLVEFDRRRMNQLMLLERVVTATVATADAVRYLTAAVENDQDPSHDGVAPPAIDVCRAVLRHDAQAARKALPRLHDDLRDRPLLYCPLAAGGDAHQVVAAQKLQHLLGDLVMALPRLGLFRETCDLVVLAQTMELSHPVGRGAVSEFDRLFRQAYSALVQSIVEIAAVWDRTNAADDQISDARLIECLEPVTEKLLQRWLLHSRSLRLSVLEKVMDDTQWRQLVDFIRRFGGDLLTQSFFHVGNLRAILQQGVDAWLTQLAQSADPSSRFGLLDELDRSIPRARACAHLELICEAILEHYPEYKDYNTIATMSDRGEMLYVLLDFLRLKVRYDRVMWNLRPIFFAHEMLVRGGRLRAARLWQRTFRDKTREAADWHQKQLHALMEKYGLRLPSIANRLAERFVRPLTLDRIRALIGPAIDEQRMGKQSPSFRVLQKEIARFTGEPSGAGLDVPPWLQTLEREVEEVEKQHACRVRKLSPIPQAALNFEDLFGQLDSWQPPQSS